MLRLKSTYALVLMILITGLLARPARAQQNLFYLDRLRDALVCCCIFAAVNFILTVAGLLADERWYGLGFTAAAAAGALTAGAYYNRALRRLEYQTFSAQPLYS